MQGEWPVAVQSKHASRNCSSGPKIQRTLMESMPSRRKMVPSAPAPQPERELQCSDGPKQAGPPPGDGE